MEEIKMITNVFTKEEIVRIVENFNIKIPGFQRSFERVPIEMLRSYLAKELKASLTQKRKGRKHTTISEVYEFISFTFAKNNSEVPNLTLEELSFKIGVDVNYSTGIVLSLINTNFPEVYEKNKDLLINNVIQSEPILKNIIRSSTTDEKIENIKKVLLSENALDIKINSYITEIKSIYSINFYEEIFFKVNNKGADSFTKELLKTPKEDWYIHILAFLSEKERYLESKYSFLLQYVISCMEEKISNSQIKRITKLVEENTHKSNKLSAAYEENKKLENIVQEFENVSKSHNELMEENQNLKITLTKLTEQRNREEPFLQYYDFLLKKHRAIIITSDIRLFEGTQLNDYVLSIEHFHQMRKEKNATFLLNKTILISRTSFISTNEWLVSKRYLEKNDFLFHEILGYEIEDYLKQILKVLQNERMRER
ncbi:hypothetical protein AUC31_06935 [Planococcus rifietoensis]|uniref:Uncharacterized protein n=1 Tax=Planococcus rifietoensis TaxID=200991 RepID=A0A0U2XFX2_9BACL|nr:hypothetical protein [Planococcus rifietoensis]ALS74976.1 hypothetical protein AUC31_06935 [Planococcus rifietoensis]